MYRIVQSPSQDIPDTAAFVDTLNGLAQHPRAELRSLFDTRSDLIVARAPGRLDVMGGIADYSGSLVLQMPIQEAAFVAVQLDPTRRITLATLAEHPSRESFVQLDLACFESDGRPVDYTTARARFEGPARHWAAYIAGVFVVLMRERSVPFSHGARILLGSRVPEGKGVSSSAAIEVAAMQAVAAAFEIALAPREMALLCQKVENLVVGAPCGVMDQMTAVCGEESRLLALLCQPAEVKAVIPIPEEITVWGLDSGVRHSVGGDAYRAVRVGAAMGYRMIAEMAGLTAQYSALSGSVDVDDPEWHGYLANLTPSEFEENYAGRLPERITGEEFLSKFQGTSDSVARVFPEQTYAVRVPAAHPIYENERVRRFARLIAAPRGLQAPDTKKAEPRGLQAPGTLKAEPQEQQVAGSQEAESRGWRASSSQKLELLGDLMYQSHASYSACGLGSSETDLLVRLVREAGPQRGLYGARITGGGSGGTVAILAGSEAAPAITSIAETYAERTGYMPYIFSRSSPGAAAFGYLRLTPRRGEME